MTEQEALQLLVVRKISKRILVQFGVLVQYTYTIVKPTRTSVEYLHHYTNFEYKGY